VVVENNFSTVENLSTERKECSQYVIWFFHISTGIALTTTFSLSIGVSKHGTDDQSGHSRPRIAEDTGDC
jgi:hypothetical protein